MRWFDKVWVFTREDVCLHVVSRWGKVREVLAHRVSSDKVRAWTVPPDRLAEVAEAGSWLEVAAILRRGD